MCKHGETIAMEIDGAPRDIDACIAPLVRALNASGLTTVASCCGHGHRPGSIAITGGLELVLATYEQGRVIDRLFPDIHGEVEYLHHVKVKP